MQSERDKVIRGHFCVGRWAVDPDRLRINNERTEVVLQPRVMAMLQHLAANAGDVVSQDDLLRLVWQDLVVEDGAVYQTIAKLRKALDDDPQHPTYIETIPKKGYRLIAAVETPGETASAQAHTTSHHVHWVRHATVVFAALVTGAALLFATSRIGQDQTAAPFPGTRPVSIAVLPFSDMSEDGSQAYLGDGIAEELIHTLAQLPGISVLARTSSFALRDQPLDVTAIAQRLDADAILEGSIRRDGEKLWVTAQLVDGRNGLHYWSEKYERPATDVLSVQADIAMRVADTVQESMDAIASVDAGHRPSAEAYELYLLGRHQSELRRRESLDRAIRYLDESIAADPDYPRAHAALAKTYFLASDERYGSVPETIAIERASAAAARAVELDARLSDGWVELARLEAYRGAYDAAEEINSRALELNPRDPYALSLLGDIRFGQDRPIEALEAFRRALEVDPLSARRHLMAAFIAAANDLIDEAEFHYRTAVEIDPTWHQAWYSGAVFFMRIGNLPEAARWAARAATVEAPGERNIHSAAHIAGYTWFMLGNYEQAEIWFDMARATAPKPEPFFIENGRIHLLLAQGRDQAAHQLLAEFATEDQSNPGVFALGGLYELMMGHDDHALTMFERARAMPSDPALGAGRSNLIQDGFAGFGYMPALTLAHLYMKLGRVEEAAALVEDCRAFLSDHGALGGPTYLRASLALFQGDKPLSLSLLREAMYKGWVRRWYFERDPNMASIRDDSEASQIAGDMSARIADMRRDLERDPGEAIRSSYEAALGD